MSMHRLVRARFEPTSGPPNGNAALSLSTVGNGSVVVDPPGSSCGSDCYSFDAGTAVQLTAVSGPDAVFESWSGACSGTDEICDRVTDVDKSVAAHFGRDGISSSAVNRSVAGTNCGAFINSQADQLERRHARILNPASNARPLWVICPVLSPADGEARSWDHIGGWVNAFRNPEQDTQQRVQCIVWQYSSVNTHLPRVSQQGVISVATLSSDQQGTIGTHYVDSRSFTLDFPQTGRDYVTVSCQLRRGAGINSVDVKRAGAPWYGFLKLRLGCRSGCVG